MGKFKKGDRVRLVRPCSGGGPPIGTMGEVTEAYAGKDFHTVFYAGWEEGWGNGQRGGASSNWHTDSDRLEIVDGLNADNMKTVLTAINEGKLLGMTYLNSKGEETYRIVKPNTISESNGLQMTCFCHLRGALRTLKLANIKKCWLLGKAE